MEPTHKPTKNLFEDPITLEQLESRLELASPMSKPHFILFDWEV